MGGRAALGAASGPDRDRRRCRRRSRLATHRCRIPGTAAGACSSRHRFGCRSSCIGRCRPIRRCPQEQDWPWCLLLGNATSYPARRRKNAACAGHPSTPAGQDDCMQNTSRGAGLCRRARRPTLLPAAGKQAGPPKSTGRRLFSPGPPGVLEYGRNPRAPRASLRLAPFGHQWAGTRTTGARPCRLMPPVAADAPPPSRVPPARSRKQTRPTGLSAGRRKVGSGTLPARLGHSQATNPLEMAMRMRGLEPPRGCPHTDLNRARLPIPPHPRGRPV
jgi:hypothetical protein